MRHIAAPIGIAPEFGISSKAFLWVRMPTQDAPHTGDPIERRLFRYNSLCSRLAERSAGDIAQRDSLRLVERLEPTRLPDRIARPKRLDMHRGDDVLVAGVPHIVVDQVVVG